MILILACMYRSNYGTCITTVHVHTCHLHVRIQKYQSAIMAQGSGIFALVSPYIMDGTK